MKKRQAEIELSAEEQDILESYERDEWRSISNLQKQRQRYRTYATATLEADGIISIALPAQDLEVIRRKAAAAGVSHEALIARIVHEFASQR